MIEEWKLIEGYGGKYKISSFGRVKRIGRVAKDIHRRDFFIPDKMMKISDNGHGYMRTYLSENGKDKMFFIHVLVAKYFVPNPEKKKQVNHKSGDKKDNSVYNLEWCTPSENISHAFKNGLMSNKGENHPRSKFTNAQVKEIRTLLREGHSQLELSIKYNCAKNTISSINCKTNWNYD